MADLWKVANRVVFAGLFFYFVGIVVFSVMRLQVR